MAELGRLNKDGYDMAQFISIMGEHLPKSLPGPLRTSQLDKRSSCPPPSRGGLQAVL